MFKRMFSVLAGALALGALADAQPHTKDSLETIKKSLADKKAVLFDVREKSEWDMGHLKDATLLPLSALKGATLPKEVTELLPNDKIIYAHCAAGKRCVTAAELLKKHGYAVRAMKDGYAALLQAGFAKAD